MADSANFGAAGNAGRDVDAAEVERNPIVGLARLNEGLERERGGATLQWAEKAEQRESVAEGEAMLFFADSSKLRVRTKKKLERE